MTSKQTQNKKGRLRRWSKRLLLMAIGFLVAGVLLEIAVLVFLGEQPKFPRHVVTAEFGLRVNQPNSDYRHKSADVNVRFRINQRGLRADREYPYKKPAGIKRIVSLGDSFTVGYEVQVEHCFSSVLERELKQRGYAVEVINAGVSGYSNAEALLYLERELLKYDPDLVLLSFYSNDLVDNVRTGLFRVEDDGKLVQTAKNYAPMGWVSDLLNRNFILSFLSERSNAFVFVKEQVTMMLKRDVARQNIENLQATQEQPVDLEADRKARYEYQQRLAAAIIGRMHQLLRARNIALVVQSIPSYGRNPERLVDQFPHKQLDAEARGIPVLRASHFLKPFLGNQQIYWLRSHRHWTPLAHETAGKEIAKLVHERGLLR